MPPAILAAYARHRPRVEAERQLLIEQAVAAAMSHPRDRAAWERSVMRRAGIAPRARVATREEIAAMGGQVIDESTTKERRGRESR